MINQIIENFRNADAIVLHSDAMRYEVQAYFAPVTQVTDNEVLALSWTDHMGHKCFTTFTEESLSAFSFDVEHGQFLISDSEGTRCVLMLYKDDRPLGLELSSTLEADESLLAHVFVQEGGSSGEFYLHAYDSGTDAQNARVACADEGSYRTSAVVEVPGNLARNPDFYEVAAALVTASHDLDYGSAE